MYDYKIIIKMSDGSEYSYIIRNNKHVLSESEKNHIVDNIFSANFLNFYEYGEYVVLNTSQITSVRFREYFDNKFSK